MEISTPTKDTTMTPQLQGINASSGGLIKATVGAAAVAGAILTLVWLPAEYGIDPTGAGHILGLTEMGHIKEQLHAEADADAAAAQTLDDSPSSLNLTDINKILDAMQLQLTAIAASLETTTAPASTITQTASDTSEAKPLSHESTNLWRDEVNYTLMPTEGIEIKLVMNEGAVAEFEWTANGAVLNHDTHGDGNGARISYEKGRSISEQSGQLVAAFTGNHGWFWRNRTDDKVVLTLRIRGEYQDVTLP